VQQAYGPRLAGTGPGLTRIQGRLAGGGQPVHPALRRPLEPLTLTFLHRVRVGPVGQVLTQPLQLARLQTRRQPLGTWLRGSRPSYGGCGQQLLLGGDGQLVVVDLTGGPADHVRRVERDLTGGDRLAGGLQAW
jgi:hypothetical protein